jgi:hypothetical protein
VQSVRTMLVSAGILIVIAFVLRAYLPRTWYLPGGWPLGSHWFRWNSVVFWVVLGAGLAAGLMAFFRSMLSGTGTQ